MSAPTAILAPQREWEDREWFPPGPQLAICLSGGKERLADLTDDELLQVAKAARRQTSWAQARELAAIAELTQRRVRAEADGDPDYRFLSARESVTEEVAAALTITSNASATLLHLAEQLTGPLADTGTALEAGQIDLAKSRVISDLTDGLPQQVTQRVQAAVLEKASTRTTGQLRRRIRRITQRLAPEAIEERKQEAVRHRRLELWDTPSGTTDLSLCDLATEDAHAIYNKITAAANGIKADGDPRPLKTIRADLATHLLHGAPLPDAIRDLLPQSGTDAHPTPQSHPTPATEHTPQAQTPGGISRVLSPEHARQVGTWGDVPCVPSAVHPRPALRPGDLPFVSVGVCGDLAGAREAPAPGDLSCALTTPGDGPYPNEAVADGVSQPSSPDVTHSSAPQGWGARELEGEAQQASAKPEFAGGGGPCRVPGVIEDGVLARPGSGGDPPCELGLIQSDGPRRSNESPAPLPGAVSEKHPDGEAEISALTDVIGRRLAHVSGRVPARELPSAVRRAVQRIQHELAGAREAACQGDDDAHGRPGYRPPAAMRREVEARHGTCVFPSCNQPSHTCDLDHTVPWRPGSTCRCNLAPLCRRHHRLKQRPDWKLAQVWPGLLIWVTPSGAWYIVRPDRQ